MKISKRQLIRIIKEEKAVLEQSWRQNPAKIRLERRKRDRQRMIDTMTFEQLKRRAFDSALGIQGRLNTGQYEYDDIWEVEIPMLADYIDAAKIKAAEEGVTYDDIPEVRHNGGIVDLSRYSLGLPASIKESKMKITRRQLRRIIKEAIDVVNAETGEVLELGDAAGTNPPEAAWPDLKRRLGLQPESEGSDYAELSAEDFMRLTDETEGKRRSRHYRAEEKRLNPEMLLNRLSDWARDAADDWMADNPGQDIGDVAYDLAKGAEFAFKPDEWRTMSYEFDTDRDFHDFIVNSMV